MISDKIKMDFFKHAIVNEETHESKQTKVKLGKRLKINAGNNEELDSMLKF